MFNPRHYLTYLRYSKYFPVIVGGLVGLLILLVSIPTYLAMTNTPKPVTLRFWGYWEPEVVAPLLKDFQEKNSNVTVIYEKKELERYREILQSRIENGSGPDVFYFHSKWLPMLRTQLVELPKEVMNEQTFGSVFVPIANKDLKMSGKIWGLPVSFEGLALLYNNELFKTVGLSVPPISWDEMRLKYLPLLTVKNNANEIQNAGLALGTSNNIDRVSEIVQLMMAQNGTSFLKNNELVINKSFSNGVANRNLGFDALTFYRSFADQESGSWAHNLPGSTEAFINGQVAMIFATNRDLPNILKLSHDLGTPLDLKVAQVPQLPAQENVTWGTTWSLGVSKMSVSQKYSWELIKALVTKQSADQIIENQKQVSSFVDIPARMDSAKELKNDAYLGPYVSQMSSATNFFGVEQTFDNGLNDETSVLFREMIGNAGSSQDFDKTADKMTQVLIQYGIIIPVSP